MGDLWWWITALAVVALFGGLALFTNGRRTGIEWQRIAGTILMALGFVYAFVYWLELVSTG